MGKTSSEIRVLPYAAAEARPAGRGAGAVLFIAWVYPVLPLVALYLTWVCAWVSLGHPPRPGPDDPNDVSGIDAPYVAAALLMMTMPFGLPVGLGLGLVLTPRWVRSRRGRRGSARIVLLMAALLAVYAGSFTLLRWDPLRVLYWYMD